MTTVMYKAAAPGGGPAPVVSFTDSPEIAEIRRLGCEQILVKGMDSGVTTLNLYNAAAPSLKEEIAVTVADFPEMAGYGSLTIYPPPESSEAYTDGEYSLTFDSPPELLKGGTIWIYDADSGEAADILCFNDERQITSFKTNNNIFVGDQLVRIEGNTVYFTPHFNKIDYNKKYFIAIPKNSIKGEINGIPFDGLPADMWEAEWTFTTKAPPELLLPQPLTVNCNPDAKADFRTIYGAMLAVREKQGAWTINAAPGIYRELIHYNGTADITINGMTNTPFGRDVIIQYTNCNQMNGGTFIRPVFCFSGANLTLRNVTIRNTTERGVSYTGGPVPEDTQAEALNFADSAKSVTAVNCSFISLQDTIQTAGRGRFSGCYIEGDIDFIWGTADVCLIENCDIFCVNDPKRAVKEAYLLVSRCGNSVDETVPKGFVILHSRVIVADGMTLFFGRNAGGTGFYDQCAVVNCDVITEAGGRLDPALWKQSPYIFIPGAEVHAGWKVYGITLNGKPFATTAKLPNTAEIPVQLYTSEYSNPDVILNRVYDKKGSYRPVE